MTAQRTLKELEEYKRRKTSEVVRMSRWEPCNGQWRGAVVVIGKRMYIHGKVSFERLLWTYTSDVLAFRREVIRECSHDHCKTALRVGEYLPWQRYK